MSWVAVGVAAVGTTVSLVQANQKKKAAAKLKTERDAALAAIPLEDPNQVAFLEEARRRRRAFQTGTIFESDRRNLRSAQSGTQQNILRQAGGTGGAAIAGLSRTQLAANKGLSDLSRQSQQAQLALTQQIGQQTNLISKRKTQLQALKFSQLSGEYAQEQKEADIQENEAIASGISTAGLAVGGASDAFKNRPKKRKGDLRDNEFQD